MIELTAEQITTNPRLSGLVKRYHTWPVIREQTVAEHSWQVARIYGAMFELTSASVYYYILFHDCGEIVSGDLPYPIKSLNLNLKEEMDEIERLARQEMGIYIPTLTDEQSLRVKIAHFIEMWEYGMEELYRGNRFASPIATRCFNAANQLARSLNKNEREKYKAYRDKILKLFNHPTEE